ncbi:MIP/aquaporin family protein [Spiroplasma alleghenense]|uniref:Glycerol uptake facilitator protein n=1 Tax=Spiroplasma alleghenense TaxID=216931 RepID=A0A345Z4R2_9MOLU|nr:MIP/aquaporin family protein [Spiroplasma alleghenense]AXK51591.1 glycerol uptake facilitator protein [Spiroplasma alleghenense]
MSSLNTYFLSEFIGSFLLVAIGNGIMANTFLKDSYGRNTKSNLLPIAFGWACGITIGIVVGLMIGGVSHLNFAITFLFICMGWLNYFSSYWLIIIFLIAQVLGYICGQLVVILIYWINMKATAKSEEAFYLKMSFCTASKNNNNVFSFMSEFLATIIFLLVYVFIIFNFNDVLDPRASFIFTFIAVLAIGLSFSGTTGSAISPTRDLTMRLMYHLLPIKDKIKADWKYAWIPVAAPLTAATIMGVSFLFIL